MITTNKIRQFNTVGNLIKARRKELELSQLELNQRLGYKDGHGQFISNIERGLCSLPLDKVIDLCKMLRININDFKAAYFKDLDDNFERLIQVNKIDDLIHNLKEASIIERLEGDKDEN